MFCWLIWCAYFRRSYARLTGLPTNLSSTTFSVPTAMHSCEPHLLSTKQLHITPSRRRLLVKCMPMLICLQEWWPSVSGFPIELLFTIYFYHDVAVLFWCLLSNVILYWCFWIMAFSSTHLTYFSCWHLYSVFAYCVVLYSECVCLCCAANIVISPHCYFAKKFHQSMTVCVFSIYLTCALFMQYVYHYSFNLESLRHISSLKFRLMTSKMLVFWSENWAVIASYFDLLLAHVFIYVLNHSICVSVSLPVCRHKILTTTDQTVMQLDWNSRSFWTLVTFDHDLWELYLYFTNSCSNLCTACFCVENYRWLVLILTCCSRYTHEW